MSAKRPVTCGRMASSTKAAANGGALAVGAMETRSGWSRTRPGARGTAPGWSPRSPAGRWPGPGTVCAIETCPAAALSSRSARRAPGPSAAAVGGSSSAVGSGCRSCRSSQAAGSVGSGLAATAAKAESDKSLSRARVHGGHFSAAQGMSDCDEASYSLAPLGIRHSAALRACRIEFALAKRAPLTHFPHYITGRGSAGTVGGRAGWIPRIQRWVTRPF